MKIEPRAARALLLAVATVSAAAAPATAPSPETASTAAVAAQDPYLWLEQLDSTAALQWVKKQNARTRQALADTVEFRRVEDRVRAQLDSDANIPGVQKMGAYYYNYWRDRAHPRGIWRRTTLDEYRKPQPAWETVIDLDALSAAEKQNWTAIGPSCLRPPSPELPYRHCLVTFSRGGGDATLTREYDLVERRWVEHGFFRPESKGGLNWIDADHVYVTTDFGDGSLTRSGYPRIVKRWRRGTPMADAETVFEGAPDDVMVNAWRDHTPGFVRDFVLRTRSGDDSELYLLQADGRPLRIDAPDSVEKSVVREWLMLGPQEPWKTGGRTYAAGSVLVIRLDDYLAGKREFSVLFEPAATTSLAGMAFTRNHVVINTLDDIKNRLWVWTYRDGGWHRSDFVGAPAIGTVSVSPIDGNESDEVWVSAQSYLLPRTLSLATVGQEAVPVKAMPAAFDASAQVMEQHFATSEDGTRIPYFLVRPKDLPFDGNAPTLLYGYGGFGASMQPHYSVPVGIGWLEKGGVYAVANIRGGGEYGPRWHQAALKANRHKAYEDFAAVARDLIARKVTSPRHLGIQGGSNGGLLVGNMLTRYPGLFGAVVIQVPLLDMRRYHKLLAGASWMSEYGDPDNPEEWKFIRTFSPYHLFDPARKYPPVLIMTSTRDDRVHPGHARKMAAKMLDAGKDVTYYENTEGGHGGAVNHAQAAFLGALVYEFLWKNLSTSP